MTIKKLEKLIVDEDDDILDVYEDFLHGQIGNKLKINDIELEIVYTEGGYEGAGENVEVVFEIAGTFWQVVGGYCSYEGISWDNIREPDQVYPKQKTITVYE